MVRHMSFDEKFLRFIPIDKAVEPVSGSNFCYKKRWWVVHPQKGIVFYGRSPQCNVKKEITDHIAKKNYPWAEVQYLEYVFIQLGE